MGNKDYTATTSDGGEENQWTGSSEASGTDLVKLRKRYMQNYLQVIYNLYGKWQFTDQQQKLANRAFGIRMSPSVFAVLLRRKDPMYIKSDEYKNRRREAIDIYQQYRPGRPAPGDFVDRYVRSDMNRARLVKQIEGTAWFKQRFPYWQQAVKSGTINRLSNQAPTAYISMRNMLNSAFRTSAGGDADPRLHRMMFSSQMTENDVLNNLLQVFGGKEALSFATGQALNAEDIMKAALTKKYGFSGLTNINRAQGLTQSFQNSQARPFDVGFDEKTGNIVVPRI